jgi:hypothetical protein
LALFGRTSTMVKLRALLNPKDIEVAAMSFSIDFGMQTVWSPLRWSLWRIPSRTHGDQCINIFFLQLSYLVIVLISLLSAFGGK